MGELDAGLESPWRATAIGIYEKWLEYLSGRKADRRPLTTRCGGPGAIGPPPPRGRPRTACPARRDIFNVLALQASLQHSRAGRRAAFTLCLALPRLMAR